MDLWCIFIIFQNKKLSADVITDTGEVSDDEEEQDDTVVINGDCKLERQNSKQGSIKRQIVKVSKLFEIIVTKAKSFLLASCLCCTKQEPYAPILR